MQIKAMRGHLHPPGWPLSKTKIVGEDVENPCALLVGMVILLVVKSCSRLMGNSMVIPQKLKTELPYDPASLLLGMYLGRTEKRISKKYLYKHTAKNHYSQKPRGTSDLDVL